MPRPKLDPDDKLTGRTLKLSALDWRRCEAAAASAGIDLMSWLRTRVTGAAAQETRYGAEVAPAPVRRQMPTAAAPDPVRVPYTKAAQTRRH